MTSIGQQPVSTVTSWTDSSSSCSGPCSRSSSIPAARPAAATGCAPTCATGWPPRSAPAPERRALRVAEHVRRVAGPPLRCGAYPRRMTSEPVVIHTDGGCRPNPGPGGWGAVLRHRGHVREMCGGEPGQTSNNRMELTAPIMALEALTRPVTVHLYTDSTYVRSGITKWVLGWERNGWLTSAKQPVKNVDLWKRLQAACAVHQVEW